MASGLSMPVGFKNSTEGNITPAINAINAASKEQTFLGVDLAGRAAAVTTKGNPDCHLILRGGSSGPNYSAKYVKDSAAKLAQAGLIPANMVDASHANSSKDPSRQPVVIEDVCKQIANGEESIIGIMVESNIHAGNQAFPQPKEDLKYGVSITDGCIDWETTETMLRDFHQTLKQRNTAVS